MIVLDASFLIALLKESDPHHTWAMQLWQSNDQEDFVISALTLAETLVAPYRNNVGIEFEELLSELELDVAPLTEMDLPALAITRATTKLRMPDAVVLHTATVRTAAVFTADSTLAKATRDAGLQAHCPA